MENKKKKTNQDNFMLYIPKRKHEEFEVKDGKVFLIFHHNKAIEKFIGWLVKKPRKSDMELDEIGSTVWMNIDGKNTVYDLGKILEKKFGEKCQPVNDRLILYIRFLNRKNWISFERGNQKS